MAINYKQCPNCGSKNSIKILYGDPSFKAYQDAEAGKVKLGGCCMMLGGPEYFCKDCEHEWNREQAIDDSYNKINTIKASVGGFFDGFYNVEIDLENLKIAWSHSINTENEPIHKSIRVDTAKKFINQLKTIGLLNWKAKYIEPRVLDGTHWSVEIINDKRTIRKYGDNQFPNEWESFCKLINRVTGKKFR